MKRFLIFLLTIVALPVFAEQQIYKVVPTSCLLTFDGSAQIHGFRGKSQAFSGTITGDPADVKTAKIEIRLDPQTFDTENKNRDKVMREKSLEIDKYPLIEFISGAIDSPVQALNSGEPLKATIHGILRLHGVEKEIAVPVTIVWGNRIVTADGDMDVMLDDFKVYRPKILFFRLGNDIKVHFKVSAAQQQ